MRGLLPGHSFRTWNLRSERACRNPCARAQVLLGHRPVQESGLQRHHGGSTPSFPTFGGFTDLLGLEAELRKGNGSAVGASHLPWLGLKH